MSQTIKALLSLGVSKSPKAPDIVGIRTQRVSPAAADVVAEHLYDYLKKGDKLMPDSLARKADLDLKNPYHEWGLDSFDNLKYNDLERTDLINMIEHLKSLGYFWKLAASI